MSEMKTENELRSVVRCATTVSLPNLLYCAFYVLASYVLPSFSLPYYKFPPYRIPSSRIPLYRIMFYRGLTLL